MQTNTVLITGASSGIGRACAQRFSRAGFEVLLLGRNQKNLEQTQSELRGASRIFVCDITNSEALNQTVTQILHQHPSLNTLVNNAGIYARGPFETSEDQTWREIFETNVFSLANLTRRVATHLFKNEHSSVCNIASTASLRPVADLTAYAASKAAVIGLTQSLALEWAKARVRVNAVCPGIVETPILGLDKLSPAERKEQLEAFAAMHPLGSVGSPEQVADAVFFLCSPVSLWTTGVILPIDGGISLT
jgi:NAD(P)-dependent dehydrogenase (short-subunit alcohol dehydrogenase family)